MLEPAVSADASQPVADGGQLVEIDDLVAHFPVRVNGRRATVHAVDGVTFTIGRGETVGLVGESGSGKTTIGNAILRRIRPTDGRLRFEGRDITRLEGSELRQLRRHMQMVFQDPYASLNARMRVGEIVAEPLVVHGMAKKGPELRERVGALLERCGLPAASAERYTNAFSGGERQRIAIARALALEPRLIVADEAVSALDVSIRSQIINLLADLQEQTDVSYLFISHDLAVVRHISDRVLIMYAGHLMEHGSRADIFERTLHPYTEALLSAAPVADPAIERTRERIVLRGEVPSTLEPPRGCRFNTRCPLVEERCRIEKPPLVEKAPGHFAACWIR